MRKYDIVKKIKRWEDLIGDLPSNPVLMKIHNEMLETLTEERRIKNGRGHTKSLALTLSDVH